MPRRPAPATHGDLLDELRELVDADGRSHAEIARGLDPPMARSQLWRCLRATDLPVSTVDRIARGLRDPRALALVLVLPAD